jgi:hypothetical protein
VASSDMMFIRNFEKIRQLVRKLKEDTRARARTHTAWLSHTFFLWKEIGLKSSLMAYR